MFEALILIRFDLPGKNNDNKEVKDFAYGLGQAYFHHFPYRDDDRDTIQDLRDIEGDDILRYFIELLASRRVIWCIIYGYAADDDAGLLATELFSCFSRASNAPHHELRDTELQPLTPAVRPPQALPCYFERAYRRSRSLRYSVSVLGYRWVVYYYAIEMSARYAARCFFDFTGIYIAL